MKRETLNVKCRGGRAWLAASLLFLTVLSQLSLPVFAQTDAQTKTPLALPQDVRVFDTPSDGGGSLTVLWASAPDDSATTK